MMVRTRSPTHHGEMAQHTHMYRRHTSDLTGVVSLIPLHAAKTVPLQRQLYQGLRKAIVSRQLPGGTRLPSSRVLADELDLSRTPVFQAYQQLLLEGYLEGRRGSGTYVARTLPDALLAPASAPHWSVERPLLQAAPSPTLPDPTSSSLGTAPAHPVLGVGTPPVHKAYNNRPPPLAFRVGQPALDAFPHTTWQRLLTQRYRRSWQDLFGYQNAAGYQPLREAIAGYLGVARGVRCTPEQVIVTSGSQQGLDLIARVLLRAGDAIWLEDPGYFGARWTFQRAGLRVIPAAVDSAGFDVGAAQALYPDARLAYVTPSHQFPLGATMSLERRLALLEWARGRGGWIVEDDYDSEYRYVGRPLPALQGLDEAGRVLYVGTFSKALFPSLRLGYLVVPPALVETFVAARQGADLHAPALEQAVVADFMVEGYFQRHIRRMRTLYAQRQAMLREAMSQHLSGLLEVHPDPAGMHLVAWLPPEVEEDQQIVQAARERELALLPLSCLSIRPLPRQALVLGYAALNEDQIADGVRTLGSVVERRVMRPSLPGATWTRQPGNPL